MVMDKLDPGVTKWRGKLLYDITRFRIVNTLQDLQGRRLSPEKVEKSLRSRSFWTRPLWLPRLLRPWPVAMRCLLMAGIFFVPVRSCSAGSLLPPRKFIPTTAFWAPCVTELMVRVST